MYENITLEQKNLLFRRITVQLRSNRELRVSRKSLFRADKFTYPLEHLNPSPYFLKSISIKWIFLCLLMLLMTGAGGVFSWQQADGGLAVLAGAFGFISLICFVQIIRNSPNYLFFTSLTGGNIFTISPHKPSQKDVDFFIEELSERAKSIRYPENISFREKAPIYRKHLDFLLHEGVLQPSEHKAALDRLVASLTKNTVIKIVR